MDFLQYFSAEVMLKYHIYQLGFCWGVMSLSWGAMRVQYFSVMEFCWPFSSVPHPGVMTTRSGPTWFLLSSGGHTVPIENVLDTELTES